MKFQSKEKELEFYEDISEIEDAERGDIEVAKDFIVRWADRMEARMADPGNHDEEFGTMARETAVETDRENDGITLMQYILAVSALGHFWVYGEELRHWHNLLVGGPEAGAEANAQLEAVLMPYQRPKVDVLVFGLDSDDIPLDLRQLVHEVLEKMLQEDIEAEQEIVKPEISFVGSVGPDFAEKLQEQIDKQKWRNQ